MGKTKLFEHAKNKVSDTLKLPKDLAKGEALIGLTGREEVYIENYKGILECTPSSVVIATGRCRVQITGKDLKVDYYTNDEMKIEGLLHQITFM
ncbi:MAG: YabP/YqfC family sporulation protein [Lachnospiraceae bacterium]|nr:YabP/YqfC family sporulation protein [Lachnospiraceae bacterium]